MSCFSEKITSHEATCASLTGPFSGSLVTVRRITAQYAVVYNVWLYCAEWLCVSCRVLIFWDGLSASGMCETDGRLEVNKGLELHGVCYCIFGGAYWCTGGLCGV